VRRLHPIFWLPGDYSMVPPGSIVTVPHDPGVNDALSGIDRDFLESRGLRALVQLPVTSAELANPDNYKARLFALNVTLSRKGIVPWAISLGDEMFDVCNYGERLQWPCFAGMTRPNEDMQRRKEWMYPRLQRLYALAKQVFPRVPSMQIETLFNEDRSNVGLWHPDCGADILAVDPYLWEDGCPWLGTGPLTPTTTADPKFGMEVTWLLRGAPASFHLRITGATARNKPVVLVAQAFHDIEGQWRQLPTPEQMTWYHHIAQATDGVIGLGFYGIQSVPGVSVGLDQLPAHYAAMRGVLSEMATGTYVPDPLPSYPPAQPPTPPPAVPTIASVTITWSDGFVQTVTR